ncbi:hypothetical protein HN011_006538 [Eciton burchellii]|nr:hypothetical protein HN011_006538 [Eciton burchellii]
MGNCCELCNKESSSYEDLTPDRETIRRKQAEAAERRITEQQQRGIKDIESVKRQQRRTMELDKRQQESEASGAQPTLRVKS